MKEGYYVVIEKGFNYKRIAYYDGCSWWQLCGSTKLFNETDFSYIGEKINI
ncbi:MAG: hypothetical protein ACM3KI_11050 [Bacillota bacterium]